MDQTVCSQRPYVQSSSHPLSRPAAWSAQSKHAHLTAHDSQPLRYLQRHALSSPPPSRSAADPSYRRQQRPSDPRAGGALVSARSCATRSGLLAFQLGCNHVLEQLLALPAHAPRLIFHLRLLKDFATEAKNLPTMAGRCLSGSSIVEGSEMQTEPYHKKLCTQGFAHFSRVSTCDPQQPKPQVTQTLSRRNGSGARRVGVRSQK